MQNVVGYLDDDLPNPESDDEFPILGTPDDLESVLDGERIDLAVITLGSAPIETVQDLVDGVWPQTRGGRSCARCLYRR